MSAQLALALPCAAPSNTVVINARCSLRVEEDQRVIVVAGLPVHHYCADDAVAEAYAMVFLVEITSAATGELPQAAVPCAKSSTAEATRHPGPSLANAQADELDNASAEDEPVPLSVDRDASDRTFDRQLAYLGLLDDAAPLFRDGSQVPGVGVLLAI